MAINSKDILKIKHDNKYLIDDTKLTNKSKKGIIIFEPDIKGRKYIYEGPLINHKKKNKIGISKEYGRILQISDDKRKGVNKIFINVNSKGRKDWYKFMLVDDVSNYLSKSKSELPLRWSVVHFDSLYDNIMNNIIDKQAKDLQLEVSELLHSIGNSSSIDDDLFEDTKRLMKMEELVYIDAIVYIRTIIMMLDKYNESVTNKEKKETEEDVLKNTTNELTKDYNLFIKFNPKISEKNEIGEISESCLEQNTDTTNIVSQPSNETALLLPILASLSEQTNDLLEPFNLLDISDTQHIINVLLILVKNAIIVFYMYLVITTRPNIASRLSNHDPFIISEMYNRLKLLYDIIITNSEQKNAETSQDIIDNNRNEINVLLVMLALQIDNIPSFIKFSGGAIKTRHLNKNKRSKKNKYRNKRVRLTRKM